MDNNTASCANCGKGEENSITLKNCGACMIVKYCSSACQKAHRPQHKKECKQRVAELHEEALFKQPPPNEDCPICMLPLPFESDEISFETCCGKLICNGCIISMQKRVGGFSCPFCRVPNTTTFQEEYERLKKLMDAGNAISFANMGSYYGKGEFGIPQDNGKAIEFFRKAAELGHAGGYFSLGISYEKGHGVAMNDKTAKKYYELAAINGHVKARHNLGVIEWEIGNIQRAYKHFIIAAKSGWEHSLNAVKQGFMTGFVTKDEYANTLRVCQKRNDEMKSEMRDNARETGFRTVYE